MDSTITASSAKAKASIKSDCPGGVLATDQSVQSAGTARVPSSGWRKLSRAKPETVRSFRTPNF